MLFLFSRFLGLQGYGSFLGTIKLINWIKREKPDLIHIHNLHGNYVSFPMLFKYLAKTNIPVVWTIHDCWAITGKCTHFTAAGCYKWQQKCGDCPQLFTSGAANWFFDNTAKMLRDKKRLFAQLPTLLIVTCSDWLKSEVLKSHLKNRYVQRIHNWIDANKFSPTDDPSIYGKYGLDSSKKILISVSANWEPQSSRLKDALEFAKILPEEYRLVIVGKYNGGQLPSNTHHISYVKGTEELSKLYSAALAFVGFSVEDTFGKVYAESMLCGTPCVVFNSTACPEVVGDCGYAVAPHDVVGMLNAVKEIDRRGKFSYSDRCIERVKTQFDYDTNIGQYFEVYTKALEEARALYSNETTIQY